MKVAVVGSKPEPMVALAASRGLEVVAPENDPELIIAYGGDGTLIGAERRWPGVPKLGIRDNENTIKCREHTDELVLDRFLAGDLPVAELMKVTAAVGLRELRGLNDVILRNRDIRSSVRFTVYVNGEAVSDETIGDGLVLATPFGSSAYFRSITNTSIRTGIGLAFNNCTEFVNHLVLREDDDVRVLIVRGPAELCADNDPEILELDSGDEILVRRSTKHAVVHGVDVLRCGRCRYAHAPRRRF
ncbi:MAG: hypothetical protein R3F20_11670 [Planctomycetota bacterium]